MGKALIDRSAQKAEALRLFAQGELGVDIAEKLGITYDVLTSFPRRDAEYAAKYEEARRKGYDAIAEQCVAIAEGRDRTTLVDQMDDASIPKGVVNKKIRKLVMLGDPTARDKLRIDTRLKLLASWDRHRYGDRKSVEHSGSIEQKIDPTAAIATVSAVAAALRGAKRDGQIIDVTPVAQPQTALPPIVDQGDDLI